MFPALISAIVFAIRGSPEMTYFLSTALTDAAVRRSELKNGPLISNYLFIPWYSFVSSWMSSADAANVLNLHDRLRESLSPDVLDRLPDDFDVG